VCNLHSLVFFTAEMQSTVACLRDSSQWPTATIRYVTNRHWSVSGVTDGYNQPLAHVHQLPHLRLQSAAGHKLCKQRYLYQLPKAVINLQSLDTRQSKLVVVFITNTYDTVKCTHSHESTTYFKWTILDRNVCQKHTESYSIVINVTSSW